MKHVKPGSRRMKAAKATGGRWPAKQQVNGETRRSAVTWIVNEKSFQNLKFHCKTTWLVCDLILLAVLWEWSDHTTLTGTFVEAHGWSLKMLERVAVGSYQGLTGALVSVTDSVLPLAVDGSRVSTLRMAPNEEAFCAPNYGRSASAKHRVKKRRQRGVARRVRKSQPVKPQIWVTLMWHMGLRLLWCWRTGPSNSSERAHFQDLLKTQVFAWKTLFCGDAGFVGYLLWKLIADQGHHFVMRIGSNVTLLRKLGYVRESHGIVYCWSSKAARQKQPPLTLRLIAMKFGRTPVYLVTNILDPRELPSAVAAQLYQLRWGIELQFRTIKQTFGRSKLRRKTPDRALRELDLSLLSLWMNQLFAAKEQLAIGQPPTRSSAALAIHAIREVFHHWSEIPAQGASLKSKLRHAVTDQYQRTKESKLARDRPDNKDKPSAGKPAIITARRQSQAQAILCAGFIKK